MKSIHIEEDCQDGFYNDRFLYTTLQLILEERVII